MEKFLYFVEQRVYKNGRSSYTVISQAEAMAFGYFDGYVRTGTEFDIFVDGFYSYDDAARYCDNSRIA